MTCRGPTQEEIEKKLLEQMDEKFHAAQQQLREELARKVHTVQTNVCRRIYGVCV